MQWQTTNCGRNNFRVRSRPICAKRKGTNQQKTIRNDVAVQVSISNQIATHIRLIVRFMLPSLSNQMEKKNTVQLSRYKTEAPIPVFIAKFCWQPYHLIVHYEMRLSWQTTILPLPVKSRENERKKKPGAKRKMTEWYQNHSDKSENSSKCVRW